LVEQWIENPCVPGSIPGETTEKSLKFEGFFIFNIPYIFISQKTSLNKNLTMKKIIILTFFMIFSLAAAQAPPSIINPLTTSKGLKINSRKGTLIEKKITYFAKFKNLDIQKITTKDLSDNSVENILGFVCEYETYDNISKRTYTIDKAELTKLIQSLQLLEQKENESKNVPETKYKFVTMSNIEFGSIYSDRQQSWINYIKLPSSVQSNLNEFSRDELKDLINMLKNADKEL
jgi:hypothetical protein